MTAHIAVHVRNSEAGPRVAGLEPDGADVGSMLPGCDDLTYPMLRLVDPYSETLFNSYQMSGLIPEVQALLTTSGDPLIAQLLGLAEQVAARPGAFLVFIGD